MSPNGACHTIEARVSSAGPGGTFHIEFAGVGGVSDPDPTAYTIRDANQAVVLASTLTWTPTN